MENARVEAGTNFNVTPDFCSFTIDRRINPEEGLEEEELRLRDALREFEIETLQKEPSAATPAEDPLGRILFDQTKNDIVHSASSGRKMNAAPTKWRSRGWMWLAPAILLCAFLLGPVRRIVRSNMIEAVVGEHVNAPADRVRALYRDTGNWARLFPATIRGARVVRKEGNTTMVEVDHVEGKVVNILRDISSTRTDLLEFKRHYDATFVNEFIPEREGMRYTLTASVRLKWPYRLAAPFVKPLVLARMRRYVVEPLREAAERER